MVNRTDFSRVCEAAYWRELWHRGDEFQESEVDVAVKHGVRRESSHCFYRITMEYDHADHDEGMELTIVRYRREGADEWQQYAAYVSFELSPPHTVYTSYKGHDLDGCFAFFAREVRHVLTEWAMDRLAREAKAYLRQLL